MGNNKTLVFKDISTPVGYIRLVATIVGLAAVLWEGEGYSRTKLFVPERDDSNMILIGAAQQLKEYFEKTRTTFDILLDLKGTAFQLKVWQTLLRVPFGATKTYGELAQMLGDIKAVRAVGGALNKNPVAIVVPCHRIVGASGKMVGFAGGLNNKSILLNLENNRLAPTLFD